MKKLALIFAGLILAAAPSLAAVYSLTACVTTKTFGAAVVTMWGYNDGTSGCISPGPRLTVPPGETTLTINLTNNLPAGNPTSIVIPGLQTALAPVYFTPVGDTRPRVTAFVGEAAVGATLPYTWTGVKPGTYLYHSGTHVQKQVQMGLYGAVTRDSAAGFAYPGVSYTGEALLLYSEVDPGLHAAVAAGTYGTVPYTSTFNYKPRYFLVNGKSFASADAALNSFAPNSRVLIRFLNAALDVHVPELSGGYLSLEAEDGNPYPYAKKQYAVRLPPLKTTDAIWAPSAAGDYVMWDRGLGLTVNGALVAGGGGMIAKLRVAASTLVAVNDTYTIAEDSGAYAVAAPGVLANDTGGATSAILLSNVGGGTLTFPGTGAFTYTPNANFNGADVFTYKASNGTTESNTATVTINVTPVNDAPVAVNDTASAYSGIATQIPVLANDSDVDGNALTVAGLSTVTPSAAGSVTGNGTTSVTFTPASNFTGQATFTYRAYDGTVNSSTAATVTVTVTQKPNTPPVAVDDFATTKKNIKVTINVIANDTDSDGSIAANSVNIVTSPTQGGQAKVNNNGTVDFTPKRNFIGTDVFIYTVKDNQGAVSNQATVRVNVVN